MTTFTISTANLINLIVISAGLGICLLCILQISKSPINRQVRNYFMKFMWMVIIFMSMHLVRQMFDGHGGKGIRTLIVSATFLEFLAAGIMSGMLLLMILNTAVPEERVRLYMRICMVILVLHICLIVISQFTDLFYYFDETNTYHRSRMYLLSNLAPLLMIAQGIYMLIRYRSHFEKPAARAYWTYLLAPFVAMIIQAFYSEIQFVIFATVGGAVYMFSVISYVLILRYEKQKLESSRIETELSMATRIQADMLPNIFPAFPERKEFDVYATMTPAKEVGGDFYDFFLVDEDHLGMVMADVSGKGVPAALFMMASKILIQNYTIMYKDPKAALEAANEQICNNNREEMFVTVWLGILDIRTGVLTAANAGHEYPVIKSPGGQFELYKDKHGFVVGGMPGVKYTEYEIKLEKGSVLFVYTDGVAEATDADNNLFGASRILEALNAKECTTPVDVIERVDGAVRTFVKAEPQFDDLTMLCFKYNGA